MCARKKRKNLEARWMFSPRNVLEKWASSFSKFPFLVNFSANENGCGLAWGWMRNVNRSWSHFYQLFTKAAAHYNSLCEILDTISNYKLAFRFFQEKSSSHPPNYQKDRIIERIPHSTLLSSIIAFTPSRFPCSVFFIFVIFSSERSSLRYNAPQPTCAYFDI